MHKNLCGLLCAASFIAYPSLSYANHEAWRVNVPIGQPGTETAPGLITASKEMRTIPGGADIVPAKTFQEGYALSMKDMLATTPGVLAQPRWGEESRLSIRGSGLSRSFHLRGITLLQDGIPFSFADGSGDFQEIDPLILQHVEVYRGGQGLRYGAASLGGAVNMVTPSANNVDYNGLMRAEVGSFNTTRLHTQAAKVFEGGDILAAGTWAKSDGYRRQSDSDNRRLFANAGVKLSDQAETRFYIAYNDINQEVPGTISKFDALHNPKNVPAINISNNYARDIDSLRIANRTAFIMNNGWKAEFGGYVNDKSLYHPIFQVVDQDSLDAGLFARIEGDYGHNDFTLGINTGRGVNDAKRFVNVGGRRGAKTADGEQIAENVELYGENKFEFAANWKLITGLQASTARRDYTDNLNHANDADKTYQSLNPKLGILYKIDPQSEAYASITRSSEAPTYSELVQGAVPGFVPVDLQTAWTAEVGSRGKRGTFSWDATLYHARVQDELLNYTVTADVPASTFNADETIHQGIELGLGWQATEQLSFAAVYTLNDFKFDGDKQFGDNDLAGAPPHQIRLSARFEQDGYYIEPSVEWIPAAAYVDYANTMKADNYALLNLKAGWEINENVSLFFDARNLTDEKTIASFSTVTDARTVGTAVFYPGDGRAAFGGIKVKF